MVNWRPARKWGTSGNQTPTTSSTSLELRTGKFVSDRRIDPFAGLRECPPPHQNDLFPTTPNLSTSCTHCLHSLVTAQSASGVSSAFSEIGYGISLIFQSSMAAAFLLQVFTSTISTAWTRRSSVWNACSLCGVGR
jgi:hypothetical protein